VTHLPKPLHQIRRILFRRAGVFYSEDNMSDEVIHPMTVWAAKNLPTRLDVVATAKLLGFAEHDIQILMCLGKLKPLGDPAPNAPEWFAAIEIVRLAGDVDWLHKATREISKYWRQKRERSRNSSSKCNTTIQEVE
jgi:hypothetical protein